MIVFYIATARTLFTLTCQGRTYRYNTIAFSWQEAEQSCTATGGSLLQATNNTQLFCADQLLQRPELTIDRTVTEIGNWIDFSNTTVRTLGLCPQWIASFNSVLHVNCSRPSPYICSTGEPYMIDHASKLDIASDSYNSPGHGMIRSIQQLQERYRMDGLG